MAPVDRLRTPRNDGAPFIILLLRPDLCCCVRLAKLSFNILWRSVAFPQPIRVPSHVGFQASAGGKMVRFRSMMHGIKDGFHYASVMAAEWLVGVVWMVATVVWSAALAIRAPNLDIYPDNDAGSKKRAARSGSSSGSVADRRVRKKVFRVWAYLTVMWCALWIFVFSYGLPTGDQATALQVIAIPPAVLLFVLIIGFRRAVNGRLNSPSLHSAE
jgi:hypothetical protein